METKYKSAALLFSLICLILSCSSPTGPSESVRILEQLLDVHAISFPLETDQNKSSEGYLLTITNLSETLTNRYLCYQSRIEPFYFEKISAEKYENNYQWRRTRNTQGHQVILTVTTGDTLVFQIDSEGSTANSSFWYQGWIIPQNGQAYVHSKGGMEVSWINQPLGHRLYVYQTLNPFWENPKAVVFDSTNGGGYLEMKIGQRLQFEAHWDSYGHGNWWSIAQGSGEW